MAFLAKLSPGCVQSEDWTTGLTEFYQKHTARLGIAQHCVGPSPRPLHESSVVGPRSGRARTYVVRRPCTACNAESLCHTHHSQLLVFTISLSIALITELTWTYGPNNWPQKLLVPT